MCALSGCRKLGSYTLITWLCHLTAGDDAYQLPHPEPGGARFPPGVPRNQVRSLDTRLGIT